MVVDALADELDVERARLAAVLGARERRRAVVYPHWLPVSIVVQPNQTGSHVETTKQAHLHVHERAPQRARVVRGDRRRALVQLRVQLAEHHGHARFLRHLSTDNAATRLGQA